MIKNIEKSFIRNCQNTYVKFLDRCEIGMDFKFDDGNYNLTGLCLDKPNEMIIRYDKDTQEYNIVGYEGYLFDEDSAKYAYIFVKNYYEGATTISGFVSDKTGFIDVSGSLNADLGVKCYEALENKFNNSLLLREDKGMMI